MYLGGGRGEGGGAEIRTPHSGGPPGIYHVILGIDGRVD